MAGIGKKISLLTVIQKAMFSKKIGIINHYQTYDDLIMRLNNCPAFKYSR